MSGAKVAKLFDGIQRKNKQKERKNQEHVKVDPALALPYAQKWPDIQNQHQQMILVEIKTTFGCKIADQWIIRKEKKLKKLRPKDSPEKTEEILFSIFSRDTRYAGKDVNQLISNYSSKLSPQELKKYVAIGSRDISRYIENRKELYVVICCSGCDKWISQSLLSLSLLHNIPVCAIEGLDDIVKEIIALKQLTAIAFIKDNHSPFKDLAGFVVDKISIVSTPWMKLWNETVFSQKKIYDNKDVVDDVGESCSSADNAEDNMSGKNENISGKRKLDVQCDELGIQYQEPNISWVESKNKSMKEVK